MLVEIETSVRVKADRLVADVGEAKFRRGVAGIRPVRRLRH